MSGKRLTFKAIYGYMPDPQDEENWIIDPEAAEIVKRIFDLTIEGKGPTQIARILHDEKVERPSYYLYQKGIVNYADSYDHSHPYAWSTNTIAHIIERPEYMGHTVNFRTYKDSDKDKQAKENPKENWLIFENTHAAIIDPETWETAQRLRKTVRRTDHGAANPLTGLVFCADCGAKMYKQTAVPHHPNQQKGLRLQPTAQRYLHLFHLQPHRQTLRQAMHQPPNPHRCFAGTGVGRNPIGKPLCENQ